MFRFDDVHHLDDLNVEGRKVFVRADLDCPVDASGAILDDGKLHAALPTLAWLLQQKARIVVGAHIGALSPAPSAPSVEIEPCGAKLAELLEVEVLVPDENLGPVARRLIRELRDGQLVLLQNLATDAREASVDPDFARQLVADFDLCVVDGLCGRAATASLILSPKLCPERAMGLGLRLELAHLHAALSAPAARSVWVVGGSYQSRKAILRRALTTRRTVLPGAELAATLLAASGRDIPPSAPDRAHVAEARDWLERAAAAGCRVVLPTDFSCRVAGEVLERRVGDLQPGDAVLDLGSQTKGAFAGVLSAAASALWLDPLGAAGGALDATMALLRQPPSERGARLVVSGDALPFAAAQTGMRPEVDFVSTSKEGVLALIAGDKVPALEALRIPL
jgi:phosphoglycerate kinase